MQLMPCLITLTCAVSAPRCRKRCSTGCATGVSCSLRKSRTSQISGSCAYSAKIAMYSRSVCKQLAKAHLCRVGPTLQEALQHGLRYRGLVLPQEVQDQAQLQH